MVAFVVWLSRLLSSTPEPVALPEVLSDLVEQLAAAIAARRDNQHCVRRSSFDLAGRLA